MQLIQMVPLSKLNFITATTKLGEDTSAPYSFTWTNVAAGTYTLTAKATDNTGLVTTSAVVNITAKALAAPTVAITSPTIRPLSRPWLI